MLSLNVGILNLGVGNVGSLSTIINSLGARCVLVDKQDHLLECDCLIMPGVGSFSSYMRLIEKHGFKDSIQNFVHDKSRVLIGICVGMQVLFDRGYENGECHGLSLLEGSICSIKDLHGIIRVPHVGWEHVNFSEAHMAHLSGDYYFTHSFSADSDINASARCSNGIIAAVQKQNIIGLQFHPEKSGKLGANLLSQYIQDFA